MSTDNVFERRHDLLTTKIIQRKEAVDKAFGVGQRPYDTVKLTGAEKAEYFASLPIEKRIELYGQMDDKERAEVNPNRG